MAEVDVTPSDLREAGEAITASHDGMNDSYGFGQVQEQGHYMMDDAGRMSGGFFSMSVLADEFISQRNQEMMMARADIQQNLMGISSALHIAADVYETGDLENAIEFAFVSSDTIPNGLNPHMDTDQTFQDLRNEAEQEAAEEGDGKDGDGPEGETDGGREEPFTIRPDGYGGEALTGTNFYDSDGNLTHTEYYSTNPNGSVDVRIYEDGKLVGTETRSPDFGDAIDRQLEDNEGQMEREMEKAGFPPDDTDSW